jgi:hypothetical protein
VLISFWITQNKQEKEKKIVRFENKREFNAFFQAFSSFFLVAHVLWSSKKYYRP